MGNLASFLNDNILKALESEKVTERKITNKKNGKSDLAKKVNTESSNYSKYFLKK